MKFLFVYLILFSTYIFGQSFEVLEKNDNLKKYKTVEIIYGKNPKKSWTKKISLTNGRIMKIENYNKKRLTIQEIYHYNSTNKPDYKIVTFEINVGKTNDTVHYAYIYNDKNQLIESKSSSVEKYLNFNNQNLPQIIITKSFDSIYWDKTELSYDTIGNVIEEKKCSKFLDTMGIEIKKYKYDKFNNVIELTRSSIPEKKYPVHLGGGRSHYENEKFRYVYNQDNLWIEKYWIVENKEYLIEKRKFK